MRLALVRLAKDGLMFKGKTLDKLHERYALTTKHVTQIERFVIVVLKSNAG